MKFKSDIEVQAGLKDSSGSNGTSGQILSSNGTTVSWVPPGTSYASDVQNEVKASVAIGKGQAVYVTSADGTNIIVGLASNTTEATSSKTLGLLDATVAINGFANVVQIGRLEGLNTSTAVVGDPVWLGTSGNLIYGLANKPYAPAHLVYIGVVTRVNANNGEIFINVQNGFELKEIHDVDIVSTAPVGNDILAFEGAPVNLWKNKTIPAVLGYTPADQAITISTTAPLSGGGNLSANRTLSIVQANATTNGYLSSADWTTFNNKQTVLNGTGFVKVSGTTVTYDNSTYVPTSRTITINGVTQDLSANQTWTVSGGIGGSGTATYLPKFTAATTVADSQLIDNGTYLSIGNPTNTRIKWGGTTTPTLGFPFSPTNALWLEVNDGDTGGIAIDNDGVTVYGAGDNGYVFRVIDEDVYQSTSNLFASTTFQVNQGQNGGGYIKGNFDISGYVTIGGSAYLASGNFLYFDSGVTNDYSIKKNGTALQFDSGGDFTFNKGVNILTTRDNALVLRAMDGGTSPWNYIEYLNSAGTRKYYVGTDTSNVFNIYSDDGTGYVGSNTSFRSPIFYDSNDTAYYGDFASTSNFRNLLLNNQTSFNTSTPGLTSYGLTFMGGTADYANGMTWTWGNTNAQAGIYVQSSGAYGTKMYFATTDSFATGAKTAMHIDHNGTVSVNRSYLQSDSSLRAPIFYDSNDTTYYSDLASTSQTATRQRGGTVYGPNTTWGAYLLVGGNGRTSYIDNALTASVCATDGNIHIDAGSAKSTYFNWYDGSSIIFGNGAEAQIGTMNSSGDLTVNSSSRAPIFYDSQNTGYYLDPNSTSNLYAANFAGPCHFTSNSGGYCGSLSNPPLQAYSDSNNSAFLSFHKGGNYALNMGLDADNVLRIGGWSASANRWELDMSGNNWVAGSMRAPIFYDSDNTGYYINAAGSSNISSMTVNGQLTSYAASSGAGLNCTMAVGLNGGTGAVFNGSTGTAYGSTSMTVYGSNYGAGIKFIVRNPAYTQNSNAAYFYYDTTLVGSISCTTTNTTYATSSDYRLKENIVPMESSITRVMELKPCRFNFIIEKDKVVDGFIAHEVQEVVPEAATGEKDETDPEGNPIYQGIDQSKLVPLLTSALQEAITKIKELEDRLSILENK